VIGFIGGNQSPAIEEFRAGFEAGAHHVDPDVRVLAIFLTDSSERADILAAYGDVPLGRDAAVQLYAAGADVVFPAAGDSGRGALLGAEEASTPDLPRWVIGVDTDWALTEDTHARRVLGSVVKRLDAAMEDVTRDLLAGELEAGFRRAGLADGWVELSRRGGHLDAHAAELDELRDAIVDGTIAVPRRPTGPVLPTPEHALVLRDASSPTPARPAPTAAPTSSRRARRSPSRSSTARATGSSASATASRTHHRSTRPRSKR
jgi:basic membrane protein A and related proteins